jgi:very-short-patch-repair endonuclease
MDPPNLQPGLWALARRQHGVISRRQLLEHGLNGDAIKHRVATGRLHRVARAVYAVGRPDLTQYGIWMAAVLACGPGAVLSGESAAVLWEIRRPGRARIEVSVPPGAVRRARGVVVRRRVLAPHEITRRDGIPVTTPVLTLIDLAGRLRADHLEAAINEADKHDLVDPEALRSALDTATRRPGVAALRQILDHRSFTLTDSELERRFLPLARQAGLPQPQTGVHLNGFKVDFYWPELGLVVETDGLRYHRTPAEQARDRRRDQAHTAAGLTQLRFTHAQVVFEAAYVKSTLASVARRVRYPLETLID